MKRFKNLEAVANKVKEEIYCHKLYGWRFRWSTGYSSYGMCYEGARIIELSKPWVEANMHSPHEILDVILHEIAHAINRKRNGYDCDCHGKDWKAICIEIGAKPIRCAYGSVRPPNIDKPFTYALIRKSNGKVIELYKEKHHRLDYLVYGAGKWSKLSKKSVSFISIEPLDNYRKGLAVSTGILPLPLAIGERSK
jgi:predicted SprT family Zn-dependent metalloprotease